MVKEKIDTNANSEFYFNDEINFRPFLSLVFKNKILITSFSLVFAVLASIYALSLKRVWEGQFQIVLNSEDNEQMNLRSPFIANLIQGDNSNNLNTQVGILSSPSVLMPIFNFVNQDNSSNLKNGNLTFSQWEKNLNINLEQNTSILNISYKDTNKELIIPVLEKISLTYQDYSGRKKRRLENLTFNFLKKQISIFKEKSSNSLKIAQEYAIDQDLVFDIKPVEVSDNNMVSPNILLANIQIENARVDSANKIRNINEQLFKINEIGQDFEKLQYIGSTIPAIVSEGLPELLSDIEKNLALKRTKYKEKDREIQKLIEERKFIIELLKNRSIGYLEAQKINEEAKMNALKRPKGVLLKYKELIREADRDESTLIQLENSLRLAELERAKLEDPWELITKPTLLRFPVGPAKKRIAFTGLIFGFLVGCVVAFYRQTKLSKKKT